MPAKHYFSDGFTCYADVDYPNATYHALRDKSQTYSVEGDNAELRHYLACLHRRTRCYSKCIQGLWRALALFVTAGIAANYFVARIPATRAISLISFLFEISQSPEQKFLTRNHICDIVTLN